MDRVSLELWVCDWCSFLHCDAIKLRAMINEQGSQSILVSGESGAGKTETTKMLMRYLAFMGGRSGTEGRTVEQQVLEVQRTPHFSPSYLFSLSFLEHLYSLYWFLCNAYSLIQYWKHLEMRRRWRTTTRGVDLNQQLQPWYGNWYFVISKFDMLNFSVDSVSLLKSNSTNMGRYPGLLFERTSLKDREYVRSLILKGTTIAFTCYVLHHQR